MITPQEFVEMFGKEPEKKIVKFAKVTNAEGRPQLQFDGETSASIKRYPYLGSYTPMIDDRVMVIHGVVIGDIK